MSLSRRALALVFAMLLLNMNATAWADDDNVHDDQDEDECELLQQMKAPTVYGGTGLFNTYSTRTLDKGEWSVGVFWNNYDRDPGDIDINEVPVNFTFGIAERWEWWINLNAWRQVTADSPFELSGYGYNTALAYGRSPYVFFGPPVGGSDGAAFFPNSGSLGGGILPAVGRLGLPFISVNGFVFNAPFGQPGGAVGTGPAFVTDRPGYYPDFPFFGQVDHLGFDNFGRPVFGPRTSGNGLGDWQVGTKIEVIDPDDNWFSMAVGAFAWIPNARHQRALARGRTSGEVDLGAFLAFGQEGFDGHFRLYENIGYTWTGDPNVGDIEVLDRPDKIWGGIGLSIAPNEHGEFIAELNGTHWSGGTPALNERDPLDLTLGARFFFMEGQLSFGAAYRYNFNHDDQVTLPALNVAAVGFVPAPPRTVVQVPFFNFQNVTLDHQDYNGFVFYFGFGGRNECEPPIPPNQPPVCERVEADRTEITVGDSIGVRAVASDQDGDTLVYTWTATGGRVVGSGAAVTWDTTGLAPGTYTLTAQVSDTKNAVKDCSITLTVVPRPNQCPTVTLTADKTTVRPGEIVTFTATANDPDNGPGAINYRWSSSAGNLQGSGSTVTLDTTGMAAGSVTVTVTTDDTDPNCQDTESVTIVVEVVTPPPPRALTPCFEFARNNARINNACKAILDDAALSMQGDPRLVLVIDGHSDSGERAGIALRRAENARNYLVNERGVDANRIIVRSFDDRCSMGDAGQNRRIELYLLPEGVTQDQIQKNCTGGTNP